MPKILGIALGESAEEKQLAYKAALKATAVRRCTPDPREDCRAKSVWCLTKAEHLPGLGVVARAIRLEVGTDQGSLQFLAAWIAGGLVELCDAPSQKAIRASVEATMRRLA